MAPSWLSGVQAAGAGRRPSREGRAEEETCLGRLGIRKMPQGWSTQKLSWNQPSPAQVALPRGLCCLRGGATLEWIEPGCVPLPQRL